MDICGVSFKENGKIYNFCVGGLLLQKGDFVIVETEKGQQYGKVVHLFQNNYPNLKQVIRKATEEDYNRYLKNLNDAKKALVEARKMADSLDLGMQIIDSSYTFDRKQLLFNFIAESRVDFRELVRMLAGKYRTRIELHQLGVRDKSKEVGGIGPCGRTLCCASFLNYIDTISINMAKNQNIALNPSKINGACGRLLCCLSYEDEEYTRCRYHLPEVGDFVKYEGEDVRVESVDILNLKYKVMIDDELIEVSLNKE